MNTASRTHLPSSTASRTMPALNRMQVRVRFSQVYKDYKDAMYSYVLFRVGYNRDVAEDIVSDVFLKAYRNFDSYNESYALSTWLYTIARNTLIDHYRKGRSIVDIDELPLEADDDAFYRLVNETINEREVHEAIAQLSEVQQKAILGQFFDGKTAKELADELGMSHAAVRKQVSRGIAALRDALLSFCIISSSFTLWL